MEGTNLLNKPGWQIYISVIGSLVIDNRGTHTIDCWKESHALRTE